ncbi:MAG: hypothetical protein M1549_02715 [Candidatus Dependentiae bacterium]|nr:hypothetical protein [Candidatus Dependentiae bacterium]
MKRLLGAWGHLALLAVCLLPLRVGAVPVTWDGSGTPDATNKDVSIQANAPLGAADTRVTVTANGMPVTISSTGNYTVTANDTAGHPVALDLIATGASDTITLDLTSNSFSFLGNNAELLITHIGAGKIIIKLGSGQTLTLSNNRTTHGVYFLTTMRDDRAGAAIVVQRATTADASDATLLIDNYSYFGFVGETGTQNLTALMQFDATSDLSPLNNSRLVLQLAKVPAPADTTLNFASFSVQGVSVPVAEGSTYNLSQVDFNTLAGQTVTMEMLNSVGTTAWSGLLVLNNNEAYPALRADPWVENTAPQPGVQPGFVVGANGVIQVDGYAYLDYVGSAMNLLTVEEGAAAYPATQAPYVPIMSTVAGKFMVNGVVPPVNTLIKQRNPSALIIDSSNPVTGQYATQFAAINLQGLLSKIYFSSCTDAHAPNTTVNDFTVDPANQFTGMAGYGSIVFDVEGRCDITGATGPASNAIEILSLAANNTGGSVDIWGTETNFKLRTFAKTSGILDQYGKACFLINGRLNLNNLNLQHTDEIHVINERNIPNQSEPCYIGGETSYLAQPTVEGPTTYRPTIALYNSFFSLNTSAALTGVDILMANQSGATTTPPGVSNVSSIYFYYNGWQVDTIGRSLILGTNVGATAEDLGTIISNAAHFNVWQEFSTAQQLIQISCETAPNNGKVTEGLGTTHPPAFLGQLATHNIFLGHGTNISLGVDATQGTSPISPYTTFALNSTGELLVNAEYINFDSQGGDPLNNPSTSIESGQGGIFIDNYGSFTVLGLLRAFFNAMVGVGPWGANASVTLPENQVYFSNGVNIANSVLDLTQVAPTATPVQSVIVASGSSYSNYALDWEFITKNYNTNTTVTPNVPYWTPYLVPAVIPPGFLPPATAQNIGKYTSGATTYYALPVVNGVVDQFQIFNSRQGDPAHLIIDGGTIRDLQFSLGSQPGEVPTGVIILQNDANVGIGKFNTVALNRLDMGIDGITLIPNGSATVYIDDDIIVNNICQIVPGPDFGASGNQKLTISSVIPREFRIKSGATLDLSLFNNANYEVVIAGKVTVVFEPGSRLVIGNDSPTAGGGILTFTEDSVMAFEPYVAQNLAVGSSLTDTNSFRVRIYGQGTIQMLENSSVQIPREAYVGIESGLTVIAGFTRTASTVNTTAINWTFQDAAAMHIGTEDTYGGSLQVGNVSGTTGEIVHPVSVTFQLNGPNVVFEVNSQGFLGLGTGICNKTLSAPNNWRVANTYDVLAVTLKIDQGTFNHNQIYSGDSDDASLLAIGAIASDGTGATTGLTVSSSSNFAQTQVLGGGNIAVITGMAPYGANNYINPPVLTTDGVINANFADGIMASKQVLLDPSKTAPTWPATPANTYFYLKANSYQGGATIFGNTEVEQKTKIAEVCRLSLDAVTAGYVTTSGTGTSAVSTIYRPVIQGVINIDGSYTDPGRALAVGSMGVLLFNGVPAFFATRV